MFEVKETEDEELMIGTFVDVYEFADRWERFSTFQRAALKSNSYVGTLDDFALYVGYSAPMGMIYRKQLTELQEIGFIKVVDFNEEFYNRYKNEFDYYDFEKSKKSGHVKRNVKMFFIKKPSIVANYILTTPVDKLPNHNNRNNAKVERKHGDLREIQNAKRKALRKANKSK